MKTVEKERLHRFEGSAREIGLAHGRALGMDLGHVIDTYIGTLVRRGDLDLDCVRREAMGWFADLPARYREELEGLAEGSGVPLVQTVQWLSCELCRKQCSGFVSAIDGEAWVGRNNDADVFSEMWGHAFIRSVDGRIPTLTFGPFGEVVFTATGINKERLWIHHNWVDAADTPSGCKRIMDIWTVVSEALETCSTIADVERLLGSYDRRQGGNLFVVEGKTNTYCVFECSRATHIRRDPEGGSVFATNHYCVRGDMGLPDAHLGTSRERLMRMESLIGDGGLGDAPVGIMRVLEDPDVAQQRGDVATVYSNVACPARGLLWFAYGEVPAPRRGNWRVVEWPWKT